MEFWQAVEILNSLTENRYGSGPLGDRDEAGAKRRKAAFRLASKTYPSEPLLPAIKTALEL